MRPLATYLHRGIAARGFTRSFVLADGMRVETASLDHGLLSIEAGPAKRPRWRSRRVPINVGWQP